jgi:hypothetical protein
MRLNKLTLNLSHSHARLARARAIGTRFEFGFRQYILIRCGFKFIIK